MNCALDPSGSAVSIGLPLHAINAVLPPGDLAPQAGRARAREFARECGEISAQAAGTAELLVSELVTNAFQAAHTASGGSAGGCRAASSRREPAVRLSLSYFPGELLIEVTDRAPGSPMPSHPDRDSEHGRGLVLVEALSLEWGWLPVPGGGKCVYCRLATED